MWRLKRVLLLFFTILFISGLIACKQQEGPAEQAGEKIDKTIEKMGEKVEKAGDKAKKATQQ